LSEILDRFAPLRRAYDVLLSDVWGVVHNGLESFPAACDALQRFRASGGTVILITNAPRPGEAVARILDRLKVPRDAYDAIVSSGDVTRGVVESRLSQRIFHLGPERDLPIFSGLNVSFAPADTADYVVCSGLFDDTRETAEDYRALLAEMRARSLFMLCANPDIVVERGETLVYCAGALADAYADIGGEVLYCGKPHAPIYEAAIGDSIRTALTGAVRFGIDCLFVVSGVHAADIRGEGTAELSGLSDMFSAAGAAPKAVMRRLRW
jgi:HAD superfamily hydrolase (TIGR01459 family)